MGFALITVIAGFLWPGEGASHAPLMNRGFSIDDPGGDRMSTDFTRQQLPTHPVRAPLPPCSNLGVFIFPNAQTAAAHE